MKGAFYPTAIRLLLLIGFITPTALVRGQFVYLVTNNTVWIVGYNLPYPPGSSVIIPSTVNGLTVTTVGPGAFESSEIGSVTIPSTVTNIDNAAFYGSSSLKTVTLSNGVVRVGPQAFAYTALRTISIPDSVQSLGATCFQNCTKLSEAITGNGATSIGHGTFLGCYSLSNVTLGTNIVSIGDWAFFSCSALKRITIPASVNSVGSQAFTSCIGITEVYFHGNAPAISADAFSNANYVTLYYLPGSSGWGPFLANRPAVPWSSMIQPDSLGVTTNTFGFRITGTPDTVAVVEGSTDLALWSPVQTLTLTGGYSYFTDPQWTNYAARYYRVRMP